MCTFARGLRPTTESKNKRFYAGILITCLTRCYRAAQTPVMTNLWSASSNTSRNGVIHLQQVAAFGSFLVLDNWACMQIEKCASAGLSVQHAVVCPPLPPSPTPPPFLPTVLYLVLQRQSQYLVQTSHSPVTFVQGTAERTAAGQKQNIWHSGGVQTRGRGACLEARPCCRLPFSPWISSLICVWIS